MNVDNAQMKSMEVKIMIITHTYLREMITTKVFPYFLKGTLYENICVYTYNLRHVCIILLLIKVINNDAAIFLNIRNLSGIVHTLVPTLTFSLACHLAWA